MKRKKEILLTIVLGLVLPGLLLRVPKTDNKREEKPIMITVITDDDNLAQMDIEEYLVGVLLGEMPADFEEEALKAQAVAARTFTLYSKEKGRRHQNGDICTLASCCQAYISPDDYILEGGEVSTVQRMYEAVSETAGQTMVYDNSLIEATYFSSSGGKTEDAQAVWGVYVPYLQSVDSEEGDMSHITEISKEKFCSLLGISSDELHIEMPIFTNGGGIDKVCINGKWFTGMQLRQRLGLRSTRISFYVGSQTVQIVTKGYGHRVGMSQYGADAMAASGCDYKEILTHYYTGVAIAPYTAGKN